MQPSLRAIIQTTPLPQSAFRRRSSLYDARTRINTIIVTADCEHNISDTRRRQCESAAACFSVDSNFSIHIHRPRCLHGAGFVDKDAVDRFFEVNTSPTASIDIKSFGDDTTKSDQPKLTRRTIGEIEAEIDWTLPIASDALAQSKTFSVVEKAYAKLSQRELEHNAREFTTVIPASFQGGFYHCEAGDKKNFDNRAKENPEGDVKAKSEKYPKCGPAYAETARGNLKKTKCEWWEEMPVRLSTIRSTLDEDRMIAEDE